MKYDKWVDPVPSEAEAKCIWDIDALENQTPGCGADLNLTYGLRNIRFCPFCGKPAEQPPRR